MADLSGRKFFSMEKFSHYTLKKHSLQKSRLHTIPGLWSHISIFPFYKHMAFFAIISDDMGKEKRKEALAGIPEYYDGFAINISKI